MNGYIGIGIGNGNFLGQPFAFGAARHAQLEHGFRQAVLENREAGTAGMGSRCLQKFHRAALKAFQSGLHVGEIEG